MGVVVGTMGVVVGTVVVVGDGVNAIEEYI